MPLALHFHPVAKFCFVKIAIQPMFCSPMKRLSSLRRRWWRWWHMLSLKERSFDTASSSVRGGEFAGSVGA